MSLWNKVPLPIPFQSPSKQSRSASEHEEDIRRQLAEMERQAVAFHEVIGLLRATLSIASEQEQEGRVRLQKVNEVADLAPEEGLLAESFQLSQAVSTESWRHDRLYAHTLRQLYHRLLEAKRRFLHQWHQHLMAQVRLLPEGRQPPVTAMLENHLQGILAVGVEQVEQQYRDELDDMLEHAYIPFGEEVQRPRKESIEQIDLLLAGLLGQLSPAQSTESPTTEPPTDKAEESQS